MATYYLDTCIWLDYFEERSDGLRPLGDFAFRLIKKAIADEDVFVISDAVVYELEKYLGHARTKEAISIVPTGLREQVMASDVKKEADILRHKGLSTMDAIHCALARRHGAVLVTRDKHFVEAGVECKRPEEL